MTPRTNPLSLFIFPTMFLAGHVYAATLVYEGFNGYTVGVALGAGANANPNGNTIGLNTGTAWSGAGVANYTYTTSGLSFGSLQTSGGAVTFAGGTAVAAAQMSITTFTGTLYSSYLINLSVFSTTSGHGMTTRVANDASTSGERLHAFADTRTSTGTVLATRYGNTDTSLDASTGLIASTTYLLISRFDDVGGTATRRSTLYAVDLPQFNSMLASGNMQNYLDTAAIGTGAGEITGRVSKAGTNTATFANGNFVQFLEVGDTGTFDEYRYGDSLESVVPIPEPASAGLLLLSAAIPAFRRKRAGLQS